jgi:D-sedoheptulose 7-phosphate isomerase
MHIGGELVGRFNEERKAHKVICLCSNPAILTSVGNDYGYDAIFARQVEAYGEHGGVLIGLSTSGNSPNVLEAFSMASRLGMGTVAFTGAGGGKLRELAEVLIAVPSTKIPIIQQQHLCLYHYLCREAELRLA